jgi:pimeloyl-ACP methyl ester carboxylesterase
VLLPGIVLPAAPAYGALLEVLGERVDAVAKELEVYSGEQPPKDYGLDAEIAGILREADTHGFDRFHLVGYSGGGAASLAFAAVHGERLLSLALLEPAWAGNDRTPEEDVLAERFRALELLRPDEFMAGFAQLQLAPGVEPPLPPEGPPPAWMANRATGIRALLEPSTRAISTLARCGRSTARSISHLAAAAIPTSSDESQSDLLPRSQTSPSRGSRIGTTSTLRTGSSPNTLPTRCSRSGIAPSRSRSEDCWTHPGPSSSDIPDRSRRRRPSPCCLLFVESGQPGDSPVRGELDEVDPLE